MRAIEVMTAASYRSVILAPYVTPYAIVIGYEFILIEINARPHELKLLMNILKIEV